MAGKAFRHLIAKPQFEVVAVRAHQAHPAFELGVAAPRQRIQQRGLEQLRAAIARGSLVLDHVDAAAVLDRGRSGRRRQQLVRLFHLGRELVDQLDACSDQLGAVRGEVPVPHVERVEHTAVAAMAGGSSGFQQRGPLPQHFVVVGSHGADARTLRGGQFVEIPAAFAWIAAHQREVLRCEQHGPHHPEHLSGRTNGGAVQPRLVGAPRCDLKIDGQLAPVVHHDRRHHRPLGTRADQRCVRGDPVGPECR